MSHAKTGAERPLSPHLPIYRPMLTMLMSIAHRVSGVGNAIGFLLLAWWLVAISLGPEAYAQVADFFGSVFGRLLLFLFSWSLIHHMLGGIRHFIWDVGRGYELATIDLLSWLTIILSVVSTIIVWGIVVTQDLITTKWVYPLFYLFRRKQTGKQNFFGYFFAKMERNAKKHQPFIEKYGGWGIFLFMLIPFAVNGPLIGAIIGKLAGVRTRNILPAVVGSTAARAPRASATISSRKRSL